MTKKSWYQQTRHVLGSDANLKLGNVEKSYADTVFTAAWTAISDFEARFSRFKIDSELSKFNAQAGGWTILSDEFKSLLITCRHFNKLTHELFNPFILPTLQQVGYKGSWPRPTDSIAQLDVGSRQTVPMSSIAIEGTRALIPHESAIDFGGIGKGYMLDILAELMEQMDVQDYCLSLGGDIIYQGYSENGTSWPIVIADSQRSDKIIGRINNISGQRLAVATSGVTRRSGPGWNHLIDPRTNQSSETRLLKATVIAKTGTEADVFAKTYLLDEKVGIELPGILGIFEQRADGSGSVILDKNHYFKT